MITGAHTIIYSSNPEADRDFIKNVLQFPYVDIGHGWLIFALPPAELAFHPAEGSAMHELYLMCDDIKVFVDSMRQQQILCSAVENQRWGLLVHITLPGGSQLGVYQTKHERP